MSIAATETNFRRGLRRLWISCLAGANAATVILLWAVCLTVYLEPSVHPRLAQAGLLFPVLLVINLGFMVMWLVTSWRWVVISVVGMAVCLSPILDYWSVNLPSHAPDNAKLVMSYNIHYFDVDSAECLDGNRTIGFICESNADIICLQEYAEYSSMGELLNSKLDSLGYKRRSLNNLMIASRLSFVGEEALTLCDNGNGGMACRVSDGNDTLMVINVHLRSNLISTEEKRNYSQALEDKDEHLLKSSGRIVLSRLMVAAAKRQEQTDSVCRFVEKIKGERILLCGDMNDTPVSYTYHRFSTLLKNTWRESGWGAGISFNREGFPVHIDHIFVSEDIASFEARVDRTAKSSDHYPILVRIQL